MSAPQFKDFYNLLGLDVSSSSEQIEKVCVALGEKYRSAAQNGDQEARKLFSEIEAAYETLMNPETRLEYDRIYTDSLIRSLPISGFENTSAQCKRDGILLISGALVMAGIALVISESPVNTQHFSWIDLIRFATIDLTFYISNPTPYDLYVRETSRTYGFLIPLPVALLACFLFLVYGALVILRLLPRPIELIRKIQVIVNRFF